MTAPEHPDDDPQHDAASIGGAPETAEEASRARDLAELFGPLADEEEPSSDVDGAAGRDYLAALFAGRTAEPATDTDITGDTATIFHPEPPL